jgi:hypothetical protein
MTGRGHCVDDEWGLMLTSLMEGEALLRRILLTVMLMSIALPVLPAQGQRDEEGSPFRTDREQIGGLRLGLMEDVVRGKIPCKPRKGKEILEGATGEYVQDWKYPDCGVELKMRAERKGGRKVVRSVTVTSPCDLKTGRGIRIGSTEREVIEAYGRFRDPESNPGEGGSFVAGSVYDGMIFDFHDGKMTRIFLGAAAE